ncbi:MAG: hypothetical protein ACI4VH_02815 [Clostridia bacterium]
MEDKYSKALKEVYVILENSEEKIKRKIPENFKLFVSKNMDKEYIPNINFNNEAWEDTIMEETQQILAVIYRDYLVTKEEREELLKEESEEEKRMEQELREKYNPDNIFKEHKEKNRSNDTNTSMIKIEEIKWYKKFINKILSLFKR